MYFIQEDYNFWRYNCSHLCKHEFIFQNIFPDKFHKSLFAFKILVPHFSPNSKSHLTCML